ncbi:hypothetical protein EYF80_032173 [Liparis tanakae]|uniref:Uncharacterized protein n=1 Tax=Liparis tanakae TaxID=230148 RepID=A0A4Z2GWB0_9TELE|nr:hypothetical protein EYF80_032173 [Liparis tanakae]
MEQMNMGAETETSSDGSSPGINLEERHQDGCRGGAVGGVPRLLAHFPKFSFQHLGRALVYLVWRGLYQIFDTCETQQMSYVCVADVQDHQAELAVLVLVQLMNQVPVVSLQQEAEHTVHRQAERTRHTQRCLDLRLHLPQETLHALVDDTASNLASVGHTSSFFLRLASSLAGSGIGMSSGALRDARSSQLKEVCRKKQKDKHVQF